LAVAARQLQDDQLHHHQYPDDATTQLTGEHSVEPGRRGRADHHDARAPRWHCWVLGSRASDWLRAGARVRRWPEAASKAIDAASFGGPFLLEDVKT